MLMVGPKVTVNTVQAKILNGMIRGTCEIRHQDDGIAEISRSVVEKEMSQRYGGPASCTGT